MAGLNAHLTALDWEYFWGWASLFRSPAEGLGGITGPRLPTSSTVQREILQDSNLIVGEGDQSPGKDVDF
jgi:hypothetical protein